MTATRVAVRVEREGRRSASRPRARPELPPASPAERVALPHRDRLQERFGRSLAGIAVYSGPRVAAALDRNGACAAVHDGRIFLADRVPALPVVAHEVAHVLQPRRPGSGVDVEPVGSAAEREAADLASAAGRPVGGAATPARGLDPDTLALLRRSRPGSDDGGEAVVLTIPERPDTVQAAAAGRERSGAGAADGGAAVTGSATRNVASPPVGEVPDTGPVTDVASSTRAVEAGATGARSAAPAEIGPVTDDTVPVAVPTGPAAAPPAPELPAATTSAGLLYAFSSASPTTKAAWASTVGPELDRMATAEMEAVTADVPDLHARLGGAPVPDGPDTVVAPPARTVDVAPQAAAAPDPDIRAPEPLGEFRQAEDVAAPFALLSTAEPAAVADQIGESLAAVATVDPAVPRTAGPPPAVPTAGETDPALLEAAGHAAGAQAATAADEAAQAVLDGPGPERVQPVALDEAYPLGELPVPALGTTVPAEPATDSAGEGAAAGPQAYLAMGLPPEVQSAFDAQQHAAMQSSVSEAVTGSEQAAAARDEAKQQAVDQAESGLVQLNESSDADQRAAVTDARTRIQDARQDTLDRQRSEVDRVAGEAERRRVDDDERIRTRVAEDQRSIDASYTDAEKEVADEVAAGERRAAAEKAAAEKAAADDSWWDRAVDFVADAFDALVGAIGAIFDAVRSAVNAVLDAVAAAARAVIDAAAAFVKEAIAAFAAVLKAAVEGLIGQVFPELAAALTKAIDDAAAAATRAVDAVAEKLKAGVSALVEGLRAGLNAVIDGFRSAMTFAVGVLGAALTGDWAAVARKVLEAVLALVGIAPEAFYAFVGRAEETWQIIVDDPGAFLGHAVDAVTGGVQRFAENIGTHLQAGVIGWLTGALGGAGIVLPPAFDLMGVLDIARQVLGLTWDTLRTRAAKLIGEKNVERLQVALDFIQTLVTEGWSGLWARITDSVATVRDNVFEAIRSFLFERVIVAAVTKLATMFNPVGAVVQLVLTLWNLYTFLRDQLSRIGEVVATVVDAIGDIARGKIDGAVTAVEGVLGRLLPLAIDLLARVLGLGNVADKVREILEGIRASVDKGIDGVLQRVAAAFGGGSAKAAPAAPAPRHDAPAPAGPAGAEGRKSPTVKTDALGAAAKALRAAHLNDPDQIDAVIEQVFRTYQSAGLSSLRFDVVDETTLHSRLVATASEPEQLSVEWAELFGTDDPDRTLFQVQPRNETHAKLSLNGRSFGEVQVSEKGRHAEENLLAAHWDTVLEEAATLLAMDPDARPVVAVAINRAPCHTRCSPTLVAHLDAVDPSLKARVTFVLAPTGLYEPTEALLDEVIKAQRAELTALADTLGRSADALIRERLNRVTLTEDTTTMQDLDRLAAAGWKVTQLKAKSGPLKAGRLVLAEAAHKVAKRAELAKAGKA